MYKVLATILCIGFSEMLYGQVTAQQSLSDLSFFKKTSKSWQGVASVQADLKKVNTLNYTKGNGVLLNTSDKKQKGEDLYSLENYGDVDLEFDYLMALESNSGIYLQGRYEVQLFDSWGAKALKSSGNGGIYERWDDTKPEGQKGYSGYAPRQNASRGPGLWQKMKISFQAPRFDTNGNKISNAVMLKVELNGVLIHENVELNGPTRGAVDLKETALGPLRIQGDHGAVALRNIKITKFDNGRPVDAIQADVNAVNPIYIKPTENYILRSFMDLPGSMRVVHAVSVGSPENVHYTYDMDNAAVVQVWRGDFLNATPMWHDRGDGSSRPLGTVQRFGKPVQTLAKLSDEQSPWISDTTGTGYRPKGYVLDAEGRPTFKYFSYGIAVTDAVQLLEMGHGINRRINLSDVSVGLYIRLAEAANITEVSEGLFLLDDQSYFLKLENTEGKKAFIRDQNGRKELIIPAVKSLSYSILF